MKTPHIQVGLVIPVFNVERTIGKVLDSIAHSLDEDIAEVLLIDNCSTDATLSIVQERLAAHPALAALVTVINNYLGIKVSEQQAMEGMLEHGEKEKIIERRGFSLLDMKRYVASLGAKGAGFRAEMSDLETLTQPAIVPIDYAGFKHFVVFRGIRDGRVYIADPSAGHIVFSVEQFAKLWDRGTLFLLTLPESMGKPLTKLALSDRELGVIDNDSVRKGTVLAVPDHADALRNAVQSGMGVFNLRKF